MSKKHIVLVALLLSVVCLHSQNNADEEEVGFVVVEQMPIFKGDLIKFIQSEIVYPESAKKDLIEGTVYISFWIDTDGFTSNHKVVRGIREDLDNEALRVAKLIKFETPALQKGKPIKVKYIAPVKFELSEIKSLKKQDILKKRKNKSKNK